MTSLRRLALFVSILGLAGCLRPKVELKLTLPKTQWEEGEFLWYKLEVKNVGWRTVEIGDPFWFFQSRVFENSRARRGTFLVVTDAATGMLVRPPGAPWGLHGETAFWTNDCGNGVPCERTGFKPVRLKRGQVLLATPSIESEVRSKEILGARIGSGDIRSDCERHRQPALRDECRRQAAGLFKYGDPRRAVDPLKAEKEQPLGYRILDAIPIPGPGRYRVKAVMDTRWPLTPLSAEEEMARPDWCANERPGVCAALAEMVREEWSRMTPAELEKRRRSRAEAVEENRRRIYVESLEFEIEVVPASRPGPAEGINELKQSSTPFRFSEAARKAAEGL